MKSNIFTNSIIFVANLDFLNTCTVFYQLLQRLFPPKIFTLVSFLRKRKSISVHEFRRAGFLSRSPQGKVADGMKLYQACGHQQNRQSSIEWVNYDQKNLSYIFQPRSLISFPLFFWWLSSKSWCASSVAKSYGLKWTPRSIALPKAQQQCHIFCWVSPLMEGRLSQ